MVPFWFFPYALATGNTYVLKPSEQVPLSATRVAEMIDRAGFPPGVFNVVHGDRRGAEARVKSPDVGGVSFVGTSRVGRTIATRCAETGKRCQAVGSAKNHLVAMPDAKMDDMIRNMIASCYGCAGQRCMASSAIVSVGDDTYREVCRPFKLETQAGMIGINVGIPAPVAPLPFAGLRASHLADTKAQGKAAIEFFTDRKIVTER